MLLPNLINARATKDLYRGVQSCVQGAGEGAASHSNQEEATLQSTEQRRFNIYIFCDCCGCDFFTEFVMQFAAFFCGE